MNQSYYSKNIESQNQHTAPKPRTSSFQSLDSQNNDKYSTAASNVNRTQLINGVLDLSQKNIKEIPVIGKHEEIIVLNVSKNSISAIDELPFSIENLNLSENKISFLPKAVKLARNLRVLDLSKNRLVNLEGIQNCSLLSELFLAYNFLNDDQIKHLAYLNELEVLDISHNHVKDSRAITIIENFPKLKIFMSNMNEYTLINFKKSSLMLEQIHLDDNNLSALEFNSPKISVVSLSIKNNQLVQLKGLENLQNLEQLICDNNQLIELESINQLSSLKFLSVGSNRLFSFTPQSSNRIEELDLSSNQLQSLDFLVKCPHIRKLIISHNKITIFPEFSSYFVNLRVLDISHNALSKLAGIDRFPNLQEINLSYNSIFHLNALLMELSRLKSLTKLDLRNNEFNSEFVFDILMPYKPHLKSIEELEKSLQPAQEPLFVNFIKYRGKVLSSLPRSLTTLDCIELTDYEMTLTQKYLELSLSSLDSLSPGRGNLLDPNISSSSENIEQNTDQSFSYQMIFREKQKSKGNSALQKVPHADLDQSFQSSQNNVNPRQNYDNLKQSRHSSDCGSKKELYSMHQEKSRESYYQREPDSNEKKHNNSGYRNNLDFEKKYNDHGPNKFEIEEDVRHKRRKLKDDNNYNEKDDNDKGKNNAEVKLNAKDLMYRKKPKETIGVSSNETNSKKPYERRTVGTDSRDIHLNYSIDSGHADSKGDDGWRGNKVKKQQMTIERPKDKNLSKNGQLSNNTTHRTEASLINEIAEELRKNYDQNLQDLKSKLKESLKKRKLKHRSSSIAIVEQKEELEQKSDTTPEKEKHRTQKEQIRITNENNQRDSSPKLKIKEQSSNPKKDVSSSTHSDISSKTLKENNQMQNDTRKSSKDLARSRERHEKSPEGRSEHKSKHMESRESYKDMRNSKINIVDMSHARSSSEKGKSDESRRRSSKKRNDKPKEDKQSLFEDLDEFLMEKLVERLDNDQRLADNPYFHLYKDMLMKKRRTSSSCSGTNMTGQISNLNGSSQEVAKKERDDSLFQDVSQKTSQKTCTPRISYDKNLNLGIEVNNKPTTSHSKQVKSTKKEEKSDNKILGDISPEILSSHRRTPPKAPNVSDFTSSNQSQTLKSNLNAKSSEKNSFEKENYPEKSISRQSVSNNEDNFHQASHIKSSTLELNGSLRLFPQEVELFPIEVAISVFRKNLTKDESFIDCSCVGGLLIELLQNLGVKFQDKSIWKLMQEIKDFMPRKLSEKSFLDLLELPQTKEFMNRLNFPVSSNASKISGFLQDNIGQNSEIVFEKSFSIGHKDSTMRSISAITNNDFSPFKVEKVAKTTNKNRSSVGNSSNLNKSIEAHNRSSVGERSIHIAENMIDSSHQTINNDSSFRKKNYYHSLSSDYTTSQKQSIDAEGTNKDFSVIKWDELYGDKSSELFAKLLPYSITPPRPVFGKETQTTIIKDIVPSTSEHTLLSALLEKFNYSLVRAVKTFSYNQHKKLEKTIEEKNLLRPMQYQFGSIEIKGNILKDLEDSNALALKHANSMKFYNRVLLFHSAKLSLLSQLVENPNGFKDIYKERPGDIIFSQKPHLCLRQYQRFMKKLDKKNMSRDDADSSFMSAVQKKPRWRLVISQVFLGNCYLEQEMNFKEFAYCGESKVLELLKNGFTSIYFQKNELFLVLLAENCVPVYLCEYQFEDED